MGRTGARKHMAGGPMKKTADGAAWLMAWLLYCVLSAGVVMFFGAWVWVFFWLMADASSGSFKVIMIVCAIVGIAFGTLMSLLKEEIPRATPGNIPNPHPMFSLEWYAHERMNRNDQDLHNRTRNVD